MIQILSVKDENQRIQLCNQAGIIYDKKLHIIAIFEQDDVLQQGAIFTYEGKKGKILWLDMGEEMDLAEGLGKAVLSIMEYRGVESVTLPLEYTELAKILRFKKREDVFEVSLKGYFCCNCQHK